MLYPIGIQNFEKIRTGGFVYVDKTAQIYNLAATGSYYFLSRPRRFGKSLLVSTMEAYFQGRKELFKGLAIEKLEKNWTASPVLHLDLTGSRYTSVADLAGKFDQHLLAWESRFGVTDRFEESAARFAAVIENSASISPPRPTPLTAGRSAEKVVACPLSVPKSAGNC